MAEVASRLQAHPLQQGLRMQQQHISHASFLCLVEAQWQIASMTCMCWTLKACTGSVHQLRVKCQHLEQVTCLLLLCLPQYIDLTSISRHVLGYAQASS